MCIHAIKLYRGNKGVAPLILSLGTVRKLMLTENEMNDHGPYAFVRLFTFLKSVRFAEGLAYCALSKINAAVQSRMDITFNSVFKVTMFLCCFARQPLTNCSEGPHKCLQCTQTLLYCSLQYSCPINKEIKFTLLLRTVQYCCPRLGFVVALWCTVFTQ